MNRVFKDKLVMHIMGQERQRHEQLHSSSTVTVADFLSVFVQVERQCSLPITKTCKVIPFCTFSAYRMLFSVMPLVRIDAPLHIATKRGLICNLYKPACRYICIQGWKESTVSFLTSIHSNVQLSQPFILYKKCSDTQSPCLCIIRQQIDTQLEKVRFVLGCYVDHSRYRPKEPGCSVHNSVRILAQLLCQNLGVISRTTKPTQNKSSTK